MTNKPTYRDHNGARTMADVRDYWHPDQDKKRVTRMDKITKLAGELRDLLGDQDTIAIAEHYGIRVDQVDRYDSRIGGSIRDLAKANMEKWGEW